MNTTKIDTMTTTTDNLSTATLENPVTTRVTGNTYEARDILNRAGFVWSPSSRAWFGTDVAKTELARIASASYSRKNSRAMSGCVVEEIA